MTDEKKQPDEDENEVSDEQMEDVSGGIIDVPTNKKKIASPVKKPPNPGIIDIPT